MNIDDVIRAAVSFDHGDARRIQHLLKVYTYAALIGRGEGLTANTQTLLEVAAVLHDIGIHAAEEKYNSSAGKYQEIEGPAIVKEILGRFGCSHNFIERAAFLVGHHHTYDKVDGIDYQILLEADFLVNAYEDNLAAAAIASFRDKIFRTKTGTDLLNTTFDLT